MPIATVTSRGQVTIPKAVRDAMQIEAGDQIDFVVTDRGDVLVRNLSLGLRELRGLLRRPRQRSVSVDQMNAAVLHQHARKPAKY